MQMIETFLLYLIIMTTTKTIIMCD